MFIELTDHLICPAGHDEQYLVLLPATMDGRRVVDGELGCPGCGRVVRVRDGAAEFEDAPPAGPAPVSTLTAGAIPALLGLSGPGGFVALVGGAAASAGAVAEAMPGVAFALVNPPAGSRDTVTTSVLRAARLPLKRGSMRGVVLGPDFAEQEIWVADAARATLPGLRVVAEGGAPPGDFEVLGRTAGCWVASKPGAARRP